MNDESYEQSADMRLLELRRRTLAAPTIVDVPVVPVPNPANTAGVAGPDAVDVAPDGNSEHTEPDACAAPAIVGATSDTQDEISRVYGAFLTIGLLCLGIAALRGRGRRRRRRLLRDAQEQFAPAAPLVTRVFAWLS